METIGERIKMLRETKKMTQVRLGLELGVAQETISGYEIGRIEPSNDILIKLVNCLNTSADYLLCITENISPSDGSRKLTEQENRLLHYFNLLSSQNRGRVIGYIDALSEKDLETKK